MGIARRWIILINRAPETKGVSWCSWLSRQSNTLKVSGSNPGDAIVRKNVCVAFGNSKLRNLFFSYPTFELKKKVDWACNQVLWASSFIYFFIFFVLELWCGMGYIYELSIICNVSYLQNTKYWGMFSNYFSLYFLFSKIILYF